MTPTALTTAFLPLPRAGRGVPASRDRRGSLRARWSGTAEVLAGAALLALWALLWSVLLTGVMGPAGSVAHREAPPPVAGLDGAAR
jgi:hypothetical protein